MEPNAGGAKGPTEDGLFVKRLKKKLWAKKTLIS